MNRIQQKQVDLIMLELELKLSLISALELMFLSSSNGSPNVINRETRNSKVWCGAGPQLF